MLVTRLNNKDPEEDKDPDAIRKSLNDIVQKLGQDSKASRSWGDSIHGNREEWEKLKKQIHDRQKALKALVVEKKAGTIGPDEFDSSFRKIQDELTELEFKVFNMRLGTKIRA